ncbi:MAG: M23 family metallopeptidase, partial [Anaerolineales bacterium]|nr:M23 family metallopeptidase [Anaerolineales bacterium]
STAQNTLVSLERPFQTPLCPAAQPRHLGCRPSLTATPPELTGQRFTTYGASGGIHFGVDLSAPCGTEIVAVADGIVFAVDGPFGSPPHNLMVDHPQLGYASMYGHLLQAPNLLPGQVVKQGEVIALTGDTAETCYGRPHLHLEIRDLNHVTKYNPAMLINANWHNLALTGSTARDFARNLEAPRQWQSLYDQPEARTGGPIINDFAYVWPFDWRKKEDTRPLTPVSLIGSDLPEIQAASSTGPLVASPAGRQVMGGDCCTQPYWNKDSTQVRFLDRPDAGSPLGIWGVDVGQPETGPQFITERLGIYSPDNAYIAYPDQSKGVTVIERMADGQTWEIDTQERSPNFTPDSKGILWTAYDDDAPSDNREETLWLADVDGSNPRLLLKDRRSDPVAWLAGNKMLLARRVPGSSDQTLFILSLSDGRQTELLQLPQMRSLALSDDRRYLVYYVSLQPDSSENGTWLLDLQSAKPQPQKLPFFGAYRWRDNERLIYVPMDPNATEHSFFEYNARTGQSRSLFPGGTGLTIANNDWRISPDGTKIALVAASGIKLDGLWVLDIKD